MPPNTIVLWANKAILRRLRQLRQAQETTPVEIHREWLTNHCSMVQANRHSRQSSAASMPLYSQNFGAAYFAPRNEVAVVNSNNQHSGFNHRLPSLGLSPPTYNRHPAFNDTLASLSLALHPYNIAFIDIEDGKTELHRAVINRNVEEVKSLLSDGAAVNVKDNFGNDPLHYAATEGILEPVTMLLQFGAHVNSRGRLGRSPLHLAVAKQSIVLLLL